MRLRLLLTVPVDASCSCLPFVWSDIFRTLKFLGFIRWVRGEHVISVTPRLLETHRQTYCTQQPGRAHSKYVQFDPSKLKWVPPPPWREVKSDKPAAQRRIGTHDRQASQEAGSGATKEKLTPSSKR